MSTSYAYPPIPTSHLNERRRYALAEVDDAGFSWFRIRVCLVAGVGFFTDAYDLFAISIASTMLGFVYGSDNGKLLDSQDLGIKVARRLTCCLSSPVGTFIGQLLFGWLADVVGRKRMYGLELCIIIIGTLGQAVSGAGPAASIVGVIIMWRFIQGVGVGGDYPLSAVISSEFAATRTRGRLMTAVFAAQGFGNFAAALIAVIVVSAYKSAILKEPVGQPNHVDFCWRLLIGLGCVPGAIALYFRLTIPETPRFTMDIERNVKRAAQDVEEFLLQRGTYVVDPDAPAQRVQAPLATRRDFLDYFSRWENFKVLFGTAYSWFALDIAFYGLGLNSSVVLEAIHVNAGGDLDDVGRTLPANVFSILCNISVGNVILSVAGLIPGYWVAFLFIDSWGRRPIQLMGFTVLTIIFLVMGFAYSAILNRSKAAFVFLYCLANFFKTLAGPNTTTFIVPGEAFPTRYRLTPHGICAASGKFGAIIAQVAFNKLKDHGGEDKWLDHILEMFSFFMLTGVFSTLLLPETMGRSLEEISNENQDGFLSYAASTAARTS